VTAPLKLAAGRYWLDNQGVAILVGHIMFPRINTMPSTNDACAFNRTVKSQDVDRSLFGSSARTIGLPCDNSSVLLLSYNM
jgi:hypothetical protein